MSRRTLLIIRICVFAAACAFLYVRLTRHAGAHYPWALWRGNGEAAPWAMLGIVTILMVVNWGIEAWKWRLLMRPVQPLGFGRAFTATIAGTSIGLITPNRVGEFAGRILFLEPEHRIQGGFATLLGSIAQFVVTLLVGSTALVFNEYMLNSSVESGYTGQVMVTSAFLLGLAAVILYFSPTAFERLLLTVPFLRRFQRHAEVLDAYPRSLLIRVFLLSLLRYGVFTLQFALILIAVAHVDPVEAFRSVPTVFLITTLVPTVALTELGVRGSVAATFVQGDEVGIIASTVIIWAINIALPAIAGSIILLLARIRTKDFNP